MTLRFRHSVRATAHSGTMIILVAVLTTLVLLQSQAAHAGGHGHGHQPGTGQVTVTTNVQQFTLAAFPCSQEQFTVSMTNSSDQPVYADAWLSATPPLHLSRSLLSSYLPPGYTLNWPIDVSAQPGSDDGTGTITITAGDSVATVTAQIRTPTTDGNLARSAVVSASSSHANFAPCSTVDGDRTDDHWGDNGGWNDATKGQWPDWVSYKLPAASAITRVELYTRSGRPALRDWDIQLLTADGWQSVAKVRGNTADHVSTRFPATRATAVRIWCLGTSQGSGDGDYSRILELEIYA